MAMTSVPELGISPVVEFGIKPRHTGGSDSVPELGYNPVMEFGIELWGKLLTHSIFLLSVTDRDLKT